MAIYFLSYDLKNADSEDYEELENVLEEEYQAKRIQKSLWKFQKSGTTSEELSEEIFNKFLKKGDKLIVIESKAYSKKPMTDLEKILTSKSFAKKLATK